MVLKEGECREGQTDTVCGTGMETRGEGQRAWRGRAWWDRQTDTGLGTVLNGRECMEGQTDSVRGTGMEPWEGQTDTTHGKGMEPRAGRARKDRWTPCMRMGQDPRGGGGEVRG